MIWTKQSVSGIIVLLFAVTTAAADEIASAEFESVSLGVAHFETAGPPGVELPNLSVLLADRIGTYGVGRLVGPDQLGAPAQATRAFPPNSPPMNHSSP